MQVGAILGCEVSFVQALSSGGKVGFDDAKFYGGKVSFSGARFSGSEVDFRYAEFSGGEIDFSQADWTHAPEFDYYGAPPSGVKLPSQPNAAPPDGTPGGVDGPLPAGS